MSSNNHRRTNVHGHLPPVSDKVRESANRKGDKAHAEAQSKVDELRQAAAAAWRRRVEDAADTTKYITYEMARRLLGLDDLWVDLPHAAQRREDLETAYKMRALETHPDTNGTGDDIEFKAVQRAYEHLKGDHDVNRHVHHGRSYRTDQKNDWARAGKMSTQAADLGDKLRECGLLARKLRKDFEVFKTWDPSERDVPMLNLFPERKLVPDLKDVDLPKLEGWADTIAGQIALLADLARALQNAMPRVDH
jgi:hypothetical protein